MTKTDPRTPMRLITWNIRYDADRDARTGDEQPWSTRLHYVGDTLAFNAAPRNTFIGLQEVLQGQLQDIEKYLNSSSSPTSSTESPEEWAYISCGRDDGEHEGEQCPIYYRPAEHELLDQSFVWISETPNVPSKGWDAACRRVMTIGRFLNNESGEVVVVMNVHLDHKGEVARREGAKLIVTYAQCGGWMRTYPDLFYSHATFLMGDFNDQDTGPAYQIITAKGTGITDCRDGVSKQKRYGNEATFTGFEGATPTQRIDFIFSMDFTDRNTKVKRYAVLPNRFDDGVYASDHRPVAVDVELSS